MRSILRAVGILLLLLFVLAPFAEMLSMALKGPKEQFVIPPTFLPRHATVENFVDAWNQPNFSRYFLNSLAVTISTTLLVSVIAIFGAYGFTRLKFRGRGFFFVIILFSQMFCLAAIMVPLYRILGNLGLIDTYAGLVIAYVGFNVPVGVWLLRSFLVSIPLELEEAALVEGCTKLKAFVRVVLPLMRSGIGATAAYIFFVSWQEFLFALIFMTSQNHRTLPVGILDFVGQYETNWGNLMAASILVIIPVFVIFIFLQRQLIAGLTQGAVKG
ncbi:MAG: carbohydrate ABC transporter permease [Spirochaetia bacterium]|jgi:multiple sugar transport system permease protein/raffinose/stachyose/melibiose transport system permease protein